MLKRILRSDALRALACRLLGLYIRLVWWSGRWTTENGAVPRRYWDSGETFILAFWHAHIMMMVFCWDPRRPMSMLISHHRDGKLIADTVAAFGIQAIAGSSSRGGAGALRELVRRLKAGEYVGITPDGPRGPRMHAGEGVVALARMAGVPVIPCVFSCARRRQARSWDRFQIALPFSRGLIRWGEPIAVPRDADLEAKRIEVEQALIALTHDVETRLGHPPTPPAALGETSKTRRDREVP
jgi:lysophospholipid acyltransferase (LPLAT)-like uncharacterized protein